MLETLKIQNIAVIDQAEVPFKPGLNILSGETGAGKSIVIEAISLLLGGRASSDLIRSGCDEAVVEGIFDTTQLPWLQQRLERLGFSSANDELLIKRTVNRAGRHRIHVNGALSTLSILQELCDGLIDLCGQHEHQSLIRPATQLELLDRYGGLTEQAAKTEAAFEKVRDLRHERDELLNAEAERAKRADFLRFQLDELSAASLQEGEDEKLHQEKILLQSAEGRIQSAEAVRQVLEGEEGGTLNALRGAIMKLRSLAQLDSKKISPLLEGLERAVAETEEVAISLGRYLDSNELDPARLGEVQERLALIADLRRKYGASVGEMIQTHGELAAEFDSIGKSEERLSQVNAELDDAIAEFSKLGKKLSTARHKASELLGASVTGELKDLKMGEAKFSATLQSLSTEHVDSWTAAGADAIQFVVQPNAGEAAKPLGKIASGGELSRLMLAIRRVIADRGGIGVYLFDEIDAGIGGQTAFQVGKKLKSVAAHNQVICITHLPQVASFGDHHLVVQKRTVGKRTITEVQALGKTERKEELARMLGGSTLTKKSLENAAELLQLARG